MELGELNERQGCFSIIVAGEEVAVYRSDDVKETIKGILESKGIDSFALIIDGNEIVSSDDIPATFADCETVEVRRYVKAG